MQCNNCGNEFEGNYCNHCGQSVKDLNRPFRSVLNDLAGSLFAWDARVFKSVKYLLLKPGQIAVDFAQGRRARYMPPFQLYVFVSFLFFLTLTWVTRTGVQSSNTVADAEKAGMETKAKEIIESAREEGMTAEIDVFSGKINTEGLLPGDDVQHVLDSIRTHGSEMDKFIFSQIERMTNDPASFFTSAITIFSWSLFFLMPVFAVLLMWFFRRKGYYYTSYLIFSINLHTFLFFSLLIYILIFLLLGSNLHGILTLFLLLLFLVYEFVALRRTYGGKKRRIFFKLLVLNFSYLILLFVSGLGVLAAAFFTF